jgi:hypothetical protein
VNEPYRVIEFSVESALESMAAAMTTTVLRTVSGLKVR